MSAEDYEALPASILVRELRCRVPRVHRTREETQVTTLLDAAAYPAKELASLFGQRWKIETNLRHSKKVDDEDGRAAL